MCDTLDMNTHIPKPVKEEKEPEKAAEPVKNAEEEKKEEDKEKVKTQLNNLIILVDDEICLHSNSLFFFYFPEQVEDEKEKEKEADEMKPATETDEKTK